jgi:hypothetical protein
MLVRALTANEASGDAQTTLSEAGFKWSSWWTDNTVADSYNNHANSGNSGFSTGLVQIDFAGNKFARNVIAAIVNEAQKSMSQNDAASLDTALRNFHAINLAGYAKTADLSAGNYDASVEVTAEDRYAVIVKSRTLINNLLATDPVVQAAVQAAVTNQLNEALTSATGMVADISATLAKNGKTSALVVADQDQMTVALADIFNQNQHLAKVAVKWLKDNPDATWNQFVARDSARAGGAGRDANIANLFAQLAAGTFSVDANPFTAAPIQAGVSVKSPSILKTTTALPGVANSTLVSCLFGAIENIIPPPSGRKLTNDQYAALLSSGIAENLALNPARANSLITPSIGLVGSTVTCSTGDPITASFTVDGPSIHFDNGQGLTGTATLNSEYQMTTYSWSDSAGNIGSTSYTADGASIGKVTYASGSYATINDDGRGNVVTDYYTENGNRIGDSWNYADGSSGSESFTTNGLTKIPGSTDVPDTGYAFIINPDGSYRHVSVDPNDVIGSQSIDAHGNAGASSSGQGPGVNSDQSNDNGVTFAGKTSIYTTYEDAAGNLTHDSWIGLTHTSGSDTYNSSGLTTGKTVNNDGSSDTYTLISTSDGVLDAFFPPEPSQDSIWNSPPDGVLVVAASSQISFWVEDPFDLTRDHFNADGTLASDNWSLSDDASGKDDFAGDGSGNGTLTHPDGNTSTIAIDAQGGITVDNLDDRGNVVSEDWWHEDGTHGIVDYEGGVKTDRYAYDAKGNVVIDDYESDGTTIAGSEVERAGAVLSPDGAGFGKVVNADGSYSVDYNDAYGDFSVFQYSASGQFKAPAMSATAARPPATTRENCSVERRRAARTTRLRRPSLSPMEPS